MGAADRHQRLVEIFALAIAASGKERESLLNQACAGDEQLRREIDGLLAADERSGGMLDRPVFGRGGQWAHECPQCHTCFESGKAVCPTDGAALVPAFEGTLLIDGKYRVEKCLGRGGMGSVYRALHIGLDKRFALKMIQSGPVLSESMQERFRREGQALGRLEDPSIVSVTDAGVDPLGRRYLVMELLEGTTLQQALQKRGPLPVPEALAILRKVASALDSAHSRSVTHRDLKPANIFLPASGGVKILDFGLAELLDAGEVKGPAMGTPAYMNDAGGKEADRHALAVVAYEMLTADVPFGRDVAEVRSRLKQSPPSLSAMNSSLPRELDAPAAAGLGGRGSDSATSFVAALENAWRRVRVRDWVHHEIPVRCALVALLAAAAIPLAGWVGAISPWTALELQSRDFRFGFRAGRAPDPRLLLISLDDATLAADATELAARAGEVARRLTHIFEGQPAAVGVDLLMPVQWSRSPEFQELILRHSGNLRLALASGKNGDITGTEAVSLMTASALGRKDFDALFAFANVESEADGVVRRGRLWYPDATGGNRPSLAAAVAGKSQGTEERFWLDQSVRWQNVPRISWKDVDGHASNDFRGRLVFVGGEYTGSGDEAYLAPPHPGWPPQISGLALHALTAATILEGSPVSDASTAVVVVYRWILFAAPSVLLFCAPRRMLGALWALAALATAAVIALLAFRLWALFLPVAAEFTVALLMIGTVLLLRGVRTPFPRE